MKLVLGKNDMKGDRKLSIFICTYFIASSFNMAIKTIFPISSSMWDVISLGFEMLIIVALIVALPTIISRSWDIIFCTEFIFFMLYVFSFLMGYADNKLLMSTSFWTLAVCIPLGTAGVSIADNKIIINYLKKASCIVYPVLCFALISLRTSGTYSMAVSYSLILPILLFIYEYLENKHKLMLLLAALGAVLIMIYGARGPLLCIAFLVFVKLFIWQDKSRPVTARQHIIRIAILLIIVMTIINWDMILELISRYLLSNGINSYALRRLINGQFTESSGRDVLWSHYAELIKKKPMIGYGVLGGWIGSGEGPHNMLMEFILAFGVIIGTLLSLYSIYMLLKAVLIKEQSFSELILVLAAYNIPMYLVSGDWLEKPLFFLFSFMIIFYRRKRRLADSLIGGNGNETFY